MAETRYDLVFTGVSAQGAQRLEALGKLAQWMKVPPAEVRSVLGQNAGVIAGDLDSRAAKEVERAMTLMGIGCNLRPSNASGLSLELVPKEKPGTVIVCPACGQVHRAKAGEPPPTTCERCEVVFAKYERVAKEKKERDQVRQALLAQQQRELDQAQAERELHEAQARRKQLEEQIRRELGLPRIIRSRTGLIGSAAGIYVLGLVMAAGGMLGYDRWYGRDALAPPPALAGGGRVTGQTADDAGALDPGMVAVQQVSALLSLAAGTAAADLVAAGPAAGLGAAAGGPVVGVGTLPAGATAGVGAPAAGIGAAAGTVVPRGPVATATGVAAGPGTGRNPPDALDFLVSRLADLKSDTEWDLYVLTRIETLRERGARAQAMALVEHLQDPDLRFERGAWLADHLMREGRAADADALYLRLSAAAQRQPEHAGARVAAFCTLARHRQAAGRTAAATGLLQQAMTSAATLTEPADQAAADAEIAALLTALGRPVDARTHFQAATQALGRVADPAERLSAITRLARSYAKAGYRAAALNLLEEATRNITLVEDAQERDRILGVIAQTAGLLGDLSAAQDTAAGILSPTRKDRTLYHLVATEIASNRIANAIDLAEGLQTPAYQALAYGLLALREQQQPAYRPLAANSSERTAAAIALIADPAQKAAVIAEVARFTARGGDALAADRLFAQARRLAEAVPVVAERDRALAVLATNEALALRLADARQRLAKITDAQLRTALTSDLAGLDAAAIAVGQADG